jgi:hypothetical protein
MRYGLIMAATILAACNAPGISRAGEAPQSELCRTLAAHPGWTAAVSAAAERWAAPAPLLLAFMRQESGFRPDPRAPSIRGPYGYAQADSRTWAKYEADSGRSGVNRNDFAASMDFIGWYVQDTNQRTGTPFRDATAHYLAYSRGPAAAGPPSPAARRNAARVAAFEARYEKDLAACPLSTTEQASVSFFGE